MSFGGDTKSRRSQDPLSGVYARGSKISHTGGKKTKNFGWDSPPFYAPCPCEKCFAVVRSAYMYVPATTPLQTLAVPAGVGLMEIITEPEFHSSEEAMSFVKELQLVFQCIGTCDGKMAGE